MENPDRKRLLKGVKRAVVKVGSGVLTLRNGLNHNVIEDLSAGISHLRRKGIEVILVSSGAIASGMRKIGLTQRPRSVSQQQATAAVGQSSLMRAWEEAFQGHGYKVAQLLLTRDDLSHRRRYLNARNTILTLLSWKIIPIVNENDTVAVDEIKFGDNDNLSAMVTNLSEAQLLVNLTSADGVYDKDPREHDDARLIRVVEKVDRKLERAASPVPGSVGTGGMASKIGAAKRAALAGVPTIIANGLVPDILRQVFRGKETGTLFLPREVPLCSRKHWIAFTNSPKGELVIDAGAERAILTAGKSLLPSGIKAVRGRFSPGNSVVLVDQHGKALALGLVNYHSGDIGKIMGLKSSEIAARLGFKNEDEVIHRDNLILVDRLEGVDDACRLTP